MTNLRELRAHRIVEAQMEALCHVYDLLADPEIQRQPGHVEKLDGARLELLRANTTACLLWHSEDTLSDLPQAA